MWQPDLSGAVGPKYIAIADALCRDIRNGRLAPGDRLPPQRELSYALGVNFGTVTKAYALAAERGLVRGEIGRGTFVRKESPSSKTPWPKESLAPDRVDLRSDFPCSLSDDPEFRDSLGRLKDHPDLDRLLQYQPGAAMPAHLEAAVSWLADLGLTAPPEQVIITNGALHGGFLSLMALTRPGDLILTEALTSPAIRSIATMLHLRLKAVATDHHGIRPDDLAQVLDNHACRALYLVPNFQNPTTSVMPPDRRKAVADLVAAQGIYLIEDDVFGSLVPEKYAPVSSLIPDHAFYITSFSKGIAPGLRVGYALPPEVCFRKTLTGLRVSSWMVSPLLVEMVSEWIRNGHARRLTASQAGKINRRVDLAARALGRFTLFSQPNCPHIWLKLPRGLRESEAVMALGRKGVDVTPGEYFSVNSGFIPGALRLCLGQPRDEADLARACRTIARVL